MADSLKDHPLTKEQLDIAQCMLDSMTTREAAKKLGIAAGTAHNWMRDPAVVEYVRDVRAETAAQVANLRVRGAMIGLRTLIEIAANTKYAPSPRATAAGKLVDVCLPRRHELAGPEGTPIPVQTSHVLDSADPKTLQELLAELRRARG